MAALNTVEITGCGSGEEGVARLPGGKVVFVPGAARDLREFEGYAIKSLCAVDMFPRTSNMECCCLLVKD